MDKMLKDQTEKTQIEAKVEEEIEETEISVMVHIKMMI